jgi:hypothetical protein
MATSARSEQGRGTARMLPVAVEILDKGDVGAKARGAERLTRRAVGGMAGGEVLESPGGPTRHTALTGVPGGDE